MTNTNIAEHIPGPWVWEREDEHQRIMIKAGLAVNIRDLSWCVRPVGGGLVCRIRYFHLTDTISIDEREATARLITAAPELKQELCKAMSFIAGVMDGIGDSAPERPELERLLKSCGAALSKAEGL